MEVVCQQCNTQKQNMQPSEIKSQMSTLKNRSRVIVQPGQISEARRKHTHTQTSGPTVKHTEVPRIFSMVPSLNHTHKPHDTSRQTKTARKTYNCEGHAAMEQKEAARSCTWWCTRRRTNKRPQQTSQHTETTNKQEGARNCNSHAHAATDYQETAHEA